MLIENTEASSSSKRIAIFIDSLCGGGAEKVMMTLADALVDLGHQPHIIALSKNIAYDASEKYPMDFVYPGGVKLKGRRKRAGHAAKLMSLVSDIEAKAGKFDVYLANLEETYRVVSACNFNNCYYIIHNSLKETLKRTLLLGPIKYFYLKSILKMLDGKHLIAVSKGVEDEIRASSMRPASVQTIYNPFNIERIRQWSQQPSDELPSEPYIIHVGRVARQKRHDILFQALQSVDSSIKLVCMCSDIKKARRLAEKYGVSDRVILPGFKKNPYPWIANAKALVISSDYEGFCSVLIEALICNTIPVSTECPHGPSEILVNGVSKFLVPLRNPSVLADKVNLALTAEPDLSHCAVLSQVPAAIPAAKYAELAKSATDVEV